jgi:hypothetical protein
MKLLIFTAVWQRREITEICFMGINRLQKCGTWNIQAFAVISEESMIPICEKYGVGWTMFQNQPLGAKKNHGIKEALKLDFDYLIEIGSDDLLKNEALDLYKWDAPVIGLMDFALINTASGQCKKIDTNIPKFGAGRAIQRQVLEHGKLWSDKLSKGMDNNSAMSIGRAGFTQKGVRSENPVAIALKSGVNIWAYKSIHGKPYPLEKALEGLSEEEVNAINDLHVAA